MKKLLVVVLLISVACDLLQPGNIVFASGAYQNKPTLTVGQIRYERNGVLVSRPDPCQERIRDIIVYHHLASVDDYLGWLKSTIRYQNDAEKDSWATPLETLERGAGDCEDLAFLSQAVLRMLGYECRVLALKRPFAGHAVCIVQIDGQYRIVDNTCLKQVQAKTIPELAAALFASYQCLLIAEAHIEDKSLEVLFRRSDFYPGKKSS